MNNLDIYAMILFYMKKRLINISTYNHLHCFIFSNIFY